MKFSQIIRTFIVFTFCLTLNYKSNFAFSKNYFISCPYNDVSEKQIFQKSKKDKLMFCNVNVLLTDLLYY